MPSAILLDETNTFPADRLPHAFFIPFPSLPPATISPIMVGLPRRKTHIYNDSNNFRHRLVLSTLSSHPLTLTNIRADSQTPGLSPPEISFLRLLDKLTTNTNISINDTGTTLHYNPGLLLGGKLSHTTHPARALSYYLQPLFMLAPFCKTPLQITLHGPTHAQTDPSIDTLSSVSLPLLRRLSLEANLSPTLTVHTRAVKSPASANAGGKAGSATFSCGVLSAKLRPIDLVDAGFITRVRGLAFANRVNPSLIGALVDATRGTFNCYTADVYVHTDHGNVAGAGVGYALSLVAESSTGCLLGADWCVREGGADARGVAIDCGKMLLEEVAGGGCVDAGNVCLALLCLSLIHI